MGNTFDIRHQNRHHPSSEVERQLIQLLVFLDHRLPVEVGTIQDRPVDSSVAAADRSRAFAAGAGRIIESTSRFGGSCERRLRVWARSIFVIVATGFERLPVGPQRRRSGVSLAPCNLPLDVQQVPSPGRHSPRARQEAGAPISFPAARERRG